MLDQSFVDDERADWLHDKLTQPGGDIFSIVDNWQADPILTLKCHAARRLTGPGTMIFAAEFLEYLIAEADRRDEPNTIAWAERLFADDNEWRHLGSAIWGGMNATAWGAIHLEHLGIIMYELGNKIAVGAFSPSSGE